MHEIRYPGRNTIVPDSLEVDNGFVFREFFVPPIPTGGKDTIYDPNYGTVTYGYAGVIDQPTVLYRKYYGRDSTVFPGDLFIYPQYNHRGDAAGSTESPGTAAVGNEPNWPAPDTRVYGFIQGGNRTGRWFGSVILQGQDATGLQYKRNRYYNAERGTFTQEDPIGLAGGLNVYGFAEGDPVNLSDPFGLCSRSDNWTGCYTGRAIGYWASRARSARSVGGVIGNRVIQGLALIGESAVAVAIENLQSALGEGACDPGVACGIVPFGGGMARIPGRPFRGANAIADAYKHLERFHGLDPNVASNRLHRLKELGGLGAADDVVIGRTGDVYNAITGERLGSLTDRSLGGQKR